MTGGLNIDKEKISFLLVDAKSSSRSRVAGILREMGFSKFDEAADGVAAFHILKRCKMDCIFSGIDMPQMNGLSLLKVVSADEDLVKIPFVLIAVTMNRDIVMTAGKCGVAAILLEPIDPSILKEKVTAIITRDKSDKQEIKVEDVFKRAIYLMKLGKFDEALALYKNILDVQEDAEVYYNIGYIKTSQKKFDEAIVAFRKAVMIDNLHARAFKMIAKVYQQKGEEKEAEHFFQKAGEIFMERNMDKEAESAFNEVIKINPDTVNIYNSLGIIYRKKNDYKGAVIQYERALKVDPEDENIHYNIGRAHLENKDIKKAKQSFESAIALNPNFREAKRMLQAIEVGFK